jgi:predicted nuclease of predicted toxin-antitoxin system
VTFLVDEDVAVDIDRCLRQAGHQAIRVAATLGFRTDDVDIWNHAAREGWIIITCNRQDFLELAGSAPETGLIVLHRRRTRQAECASLLRLIATAGESGLRSNINFA